jgi:hypothetical protein
MGGARLAAYPLIAAFGDCFCLPAFLSQDGLFLLFSGLYFK